MKAENNFSGDFFCKKAFELSYALFRVATSLKSRGLAEEIEKMGARLLALVVEENYQAATSALTVIEYLMRLCLETEMVYPANCQLIINEGRTLNSLILQSNKAPEIEGLEDIFKGKTVPIAGSEIRKNSSEIGSETKDFDSEIMPEKLKNKENSSEIDPEVNSDARQKIILKKIDELGSCRLGDLLRIFPNLSGRMIRYELQALIEKGLIEKIGSSGPLVCYKLRKEEISGLPATLETTRLGTSFPPLTL